MRVSRGAWIWQGLLNNPARHHWGLNESRHTSPEEIAKLRGAMDDMVTNVYSQVGIGNAELFGKKPEQLGASLGIGESGVVFGDALKDGGELTGRQKDIMAAHEAHHGLLKPGYKFQEELRKGMDTSSLHNRGGGDRVSSKYLVSGHEIIARMAQLKNYFGMKEGEAFTPSHLAYARDHYISDTGINNNMTEFFSMIAPATEQKFLENMNLMPV